MRFLFVNFAAVLRNVIGMKVVRSRHVPFGDYVAINLCGVLFAHPGVPLTPDLLNHELIHSRQMAEMLIVPFYAMYVAEWLVRWLACGDVHRAYRSISFEREAYAHESEPQYLRHRRLWAWTRFIRNNTGK